MAEFINLSPENLADEHLCCIIRSRKIHAGIEAKKAWLADRIKEGHVFRKLDVKGVVFIEYAPLESAWVPIVGDNYFYIYCLWTTGEYRGKGYGETLLNYCIEDAKAQGKSGICLLGAKRQKSWLTNQEFAKKFGFKKVDETVNDYELLALSFDGIAPQFTEKARASEIENQELTIYYDFQCPYIPQTIQKIKDYCEEKGISLSLIQIDRLEEAKSLPCPFNNWAVFYKGRFATVNLLDVNSLERILKK